MEMFILKQRKSPPFPELEGYIFSLLLKIYSLLEFLSTVIHYINFNDVYVVLALFYKLI